MCDKHRAFCLFQILSGGLILLTLQRELRVCQFGAAVTITKYHRLTQQKFSFSLFWRLQVQDRDIGRVGFILSPLLGLLGDVLPISSHGPSSLCICVLASSSCKDTYWSDWIGPIPRTSFNLNYLLKDPTSKYSHILGYWGLSLQHMN